MNIGHVTRGSFHHDLESSQGKLGRQPYQTGKSWGGTQVVGVASGMKHTQNREKSVPVKAVRSFKKIQEMGHHQMGQVQIGRIMGVHF